MKDDRPTLSDLGIVAAAAEVYARRQQLGEEAIGHAHEIKTYALRKLGEMLKASERAKPSGSNQHKEVFRDRTHPDRLSDLGIDRKVSSLAQQIADLPMEKVEAVAKRVQTITDIQRAAYAVEWLPVFEEKAKERQGDRTDISQKIDTSLKRGDEKPDSQIFDQRGKASEQVAQILYPNNS